MTQHLSVADAADFVRGVAPAARRRQIEEHVTAGCARCARTLALVEQIVATARDEVRWEPPADVVARALDIFAIPPRRVEPLLDRLVPKLVFDSIRQPLPAGVRASNSVTRHVLYRAGDFFIDLRLDAEQGARRVSIVGQVSPRERSEKTALDAVSVLLVDRRSILSQASVNTFGEFHFDYDAHPQLRLRILFGNRRGLDVPLARLLTSASKNENVRRET
ncbi:MAG: hypothetical protein HOQ29_14110 [Acidobacteria bacterium]|nr:hypothetical protein [Acidobacteriota bacterium]